MTRFNPTQTGRFFVSTDRRGDVNSGTVQVVADVHGVVQAADAEAGWMMAEFRGTGFRVFVRPTGEFGTARNWSGRRVAFVEVRDVDTVVVDGAVMAGVGEFRSTGMVAAEAVTA